jgi:hypothetical protein
MNDTNGKGGSRMLGVYAIPESTDGERKFWPKIGIAFTNRDGSVSILLEALPLGTNKLQVRELPPRDDRRPGSTAGTPPGRAPLETVEVRS